MILAKSRLVFHVCIFQEGFRQDEDNDKSDYDQSDDEQSDGDKKEHYWWDWPFCKKCVFTLCKEFCIDFWSFLVA